MGSAAQQGELWGARARDWAELNEPLWTEVFDRVLDAAGVKSGSQYLDIGCGAGGALLRAKARGAQVSGLDASANLVAIARRRLPGARIEQGEMEELPFAGESFDSIFAINAVQFASRPAHALREAFRVTSKGGIMAVLCWGPRDDCRFLTEVMPAIIALLPQTSGGPPPPIGAPGYLEELLAGAGFGAITAHDFDWSFTFPARDYAVMAIMSAAARAIAHVGEARVRAALDRALAPHVNPGGSLVFPNRMRLVTGARLD
jgi:SAM-dependent methyltransferase